MSQVHLIPRFQKLVITGLVLLMLLTVTLLPGRPAHADDPPIAPTPTEPADTNGWTDPVGG